MCNDDSINLKWVETKQTKAVIKAKMMCMSCMLRSQQHVFPTASVLYLRSVMLPAASGQGAMEQRYCPLYHKTNRPYVTYTILCHQNLTHYCMCVYSLQGCVSLDTLRVDDRLVSSWLQEKQWVIGQPSASSLLSLGQAAFFLYDTKGQTQTHMHTHTHTYSMHAHACTWTTITSLISVCNT